MPFLWWQVLASDIFTKTLWIGEFQYHFTLLVTDLISLCVCVCLFAYSSQCVCIFPVCLTKHASQLLWQVHRFHNSEKSLWQLFCIFSHCLNLGCYVVLNTQMQPHLMKYIPFQHTLPVCRQCNRSPAVEGIIYVIICC